MIEVYSELTNFQIDLTESIIDFTRIPHDLPASDPNIVERYLPVFSEADNFLRDVLYGTKITGALLLMAAVVSSISVPFFIFGTVVVGGIDSCASGTKANVEALHKMYSTRVFRERERQKYVPRYVLQALRNSNLEVIKEHTNLFSKATKWRIITAASYGKTGEAVDLLIEAHKSLEASERNETVSSYFFSVS